MNDVDASQRASGEGWSRRGDTLECRLTVHASALCQAREFALYRLRVLLARSRGILRPLAIGVDQDGIRVQFATGALDHGPRRTSSSMWLRDVLVPLIEAVCACHDAGALPNGPLGIIEGQYFPGVTWFLPRPQSLGDERTAGAACNALTAWIRAERTSISLDADERHWLDGALRALAEEGWPGAKRWLQEWRVEDQLGTIRVAAAGPVRCLTEFELFARVARLYRYRVVDSAMAGEFGVGGDGATVLRVDRSWVDPHFGILDRPTVQELWDELTEESRTTPLVALDKVPPNPLERAARDVERRRWIAVHPDQPFVFLDWPRSRVSSEGYLRVVSAGDDTLMERKRLFSGFVDRHPSLAGMLRSPPPPRRFGANTIPRAALEESILDTRGVFAVQGPPGTGKTYLASQVVRRFLQRTPGGRVLVCSKEHFALDHIVTKIATTLEKASVPFRAWRSVPQGRRREEVIRNPWSAVAVARDLAERRWAAGEEAWTQWQAATSEIHDLRVASLARDAATVVFTTTCDLAMTEFLDRESFDLVVIEEAGKCYPSELLHAVCLGRTTLLIGDQFQLPPFQEECTRAGAQAWTRTVRAARSDAQRLSLKDRFGDLVRSLGPTLSNGESVTDETLLWLRPFEYLFDRLPGRYRLDEQFRMEAPLSRVVSGVFYGAPFVHRKNDLAAGERPNDRPLGSAIPERFDVPLLWLDTPHMAALPDATEDRGKRGVRDNHYELDVLVAYLRSLRGPAKTDLVILTPYRAQKRLLLQSGELRSICSVISGRSLDDSVRTTDEYQGREAELTVLSLVRNSSQGTRAWGFMASPERLNVMFSRARFRQVVIGCSAHVERHAAECEHLYRVWSAYQAEARDPSCARIIPSTEVLHG